MCVCVCRYIVAVNEDHVVPDLPYIRYIDRQMMIA